jgi:hypothetical protein
MIGKAKVVVGAEVDDVFSGNANGGTLRTLELALTFVETFAAKFVELGFQDLAETCVAHRSTPRSHGLSERMPRVQLRHEFFIVIRMTANPNPLNPARHVDSQRTIM